jgi:multidrug resistance efflux pump
MQVMATLLAAALAVTGQAAERSARDNPANEPLRNFVVSPINDVNVSAREAGVLTKLDAEVGYVVKEGDTLGHIDDSDAQIRKIIAEGELKVAQETAASDASVKAARATIGVALAEFEGSKDMRQRLPDVVSDFEVRRLKLTHERSVYQRDNAEVEHRVNSLTRDIKQAALQAVANEIERRQVRSPINGVVQRRYRDPGEWVQAGDPVFRVVRFDRLRVEGLLHAGDFMPEEVEGRPVKIVVKTPRGERKEPQIVATIENAKIDVASLVVDSSGRFLVHAEFDNPKKNGRWLVRPGLDAEIILLDSK